MSVDNRIGQWVPGREKDLLNHFNPNLLSIGVLGLSGGREKQIYQMKEFPLDDPWRGVAAQGIENMAADGELRYNNFVEFGTGTGPQIITAVYAEPTIKKVVGVDIADWKLAAALKNFRDDELLNAKLQAGQVELHNKHAIQFLNEWDTPLDNITAVMCLPQAERGDNINATTSDVVGKKDKYVTPYLERWGPTALQLNAGVLNTLARKTEDDARALIILSGRISPKVREELIQENGWHIDKIAAQAKVFQDSDTPLDWMLALNRAEQGQLYDIDGDPIVFDDGVEMHNQNQPIMHEVFGYNIIRS